MLEKLWMLGLFACLAGTAMADVKSVEGELPSEAEFDTLEGLEGLSDRDVVLLDLDMLPTAWPAFPDGEGHMQTPKTCDFGMIDAIEQVSVPTGSARLLLDVWLGERNEHAANGLSCEYDPSIGAAGKDQARMRLTGCYLVRAVSIPTARQLVLSPLPAAACGLLE